MFLSVLSGVAICALSFFLVFFFFQAEDGIRDTSVTGVQTCALPISRMIRRSVSSWLSPGPRVPMPPPVRDRCVQRRVSRGSWYSSCASSTWRRPSCVRADRKSVVEGKGGDLGGRRGHQKEKRAERER